MTDRPDIHPSSDDQSDVARFAALADAAVAGLGLPERDANALEQALGVRTVRDLAESKSVRRPRAMVHPAKGKTERRWMVAGPAGAGA
jgi:hypothetical protein